MWWHEWNLPRARCWELIEDYTGGYVPGRSGVLHWLIGNWPLADVVALVLRSAAFSGMQCLCLDFDVNLTAFSSMRVNL